jgi:protease-4
MTVTTLAARLPLPLAQVVDRRRIAVIPVRGVIGGALRTSDLLRLLRRAREARQFRAVFLDIHSPGGDAASSEALYLAVRRTAAEKPVVAWFRGTGASGAYFMACGATRILAFPSAIVGSIGVISARPVLVEALRRIGAAVTVTKTGPFKDLGAPWREPTEEELAKEQRLVDAIFRRFVGAVQSARGFDDAAVARVTTGEVWVAEEATELGLLDGICDEDEALDQAQELAKLPRRSITRLQSRRGVLQRLGVPGAGMGPPGPRWVVELEGWLHGPSVRLL